MRLLRSQIEASLVMVGHDRKASTMMERFKKWWHRECAQVGDVYRIPDGLLRDSHVTVVKVDGYGPEDFVYFNDSTREQQEYLVSQSRVSRKP